MRKMLTDRLVKAKNPAGGSTDVIWDEALTGFGMRIGGTGRTYFVQARINGAPFKMKVGKVRLHAKDTAALSVADARQKAGALLTMARNGEDPRLAAEKAAREAARGRLNSFAAVSEAYMEEAGRHCKDAAERQRKLDVDILPALGPIPVTDLRRADIKALLLDKAKDAPVMARRIKSLIHTVLNYAIDEELIDANPAARIKLQAETPRNRYLSEKEIKRFWRGIDKARLVPQMRRILRLLLVTGQRRSEVALMRWDEVNTKKGVWEIPAERTKAGRATRVPLSPLALELIGEPDDGEHVFHHRDARPLAVYSISQAMRRELKPLGLADKPATPHDLRRTFASQLAELGIDRLTITKLLNHAEAGVTGQVYELSEHWEKKRIAMLAWSDKLIEITSGEPMPRKVTKLRAG